MRLFAAVVGHASFTEAARALGLSKQTLSRRVGALEDALGVRLLHRTTRSVRPTAAGTAYAARCSELVAVAGDANRAIRDDDATPRGVLRVTADPVFGDAFVSDLVVDYAKRFPSVDVRVVLTRRRVALLDEGFDVAFRVGALDRTEPSLVATRLGEARVRFCASPSYVRKHGAPRTPSELAKRACIVSADGDATTTAWPFRGRRGRLELVPVRGRIVTTSFAMARAAACGGLGIAIFPEFACARELRDKKLVSVLDDFVAPVGSIWLLHAARDFLPARVRAFADLARARFGRR